MSEERKSKSDLNPGEGTHGKMERPKRSKRLSLGTDLCLPKITESGENRLVELHGNTHNEEEVDKEDDHKERIVKEKVNETFERSGTDIDKRNPVVSDTENSMVPDTKCVAKMKRLPLEQEDEKFEEPKTVNVIHAKDIGVNEVTSQDNKTARENAKTKHSAINKLVKENSKDILNIIDKIKCVQKLQEPVEDHHKARCTHAKANPPDLGNTADKCLICEISQAAEKFTSIDTNRFLVEILYPHDYYDKYSRSKRKLVGLDSNEQQVHMPIIKPVKVVRKRNHPRPVLMKENTNDTKLNAPIDESGHEDRLVNQSDPNSPKSRLFGGYDKSTIHSKCSEGTQAMFIIENSKNEKLVLKGLKGTVRKEHACKEKSDVQVSQSKYEVNSLGMKFALPDYNVSLRDRKPSMTRQLTIVSASAQTPYATPRPATMFEDRNHRLGPFSRTLHRGFTFAGFDNNNSHRMTLPLPSHEREITRIKHSVDLAPVKLNRSGGMAEPTIKFSRTHRQFPSLKIKNRLPSIETKPNTSNLIPPSGTLL